MNKTSYGFNWQDGHTKTRRLSRSFNTEGEARKFAEGKNATDIYLHKGKYKVEWIKAIKEG